MINKMKKNIFLGRCDSLDRQFSTLGKHTLGDGGPQNLVVKFKQIERGGDGNA